MEERTEEQGTAELDGGKRGADNLIIDLTRKAVASSVKSLFGSEDGIRSLIGAIIPKEIGSYVMQELSLLRNEFLKAVMAEVTAFVEKQDIPGELRKTLNGLDFEIHATVSVREKKNQTLGRKKPKASQIA